MTNPKPAGRCDPPLCAVALAGYKLILEGTCVCRIQRQIPTRRLARLLTETPIGLG